MLLLFQNNQIRGYRPVFLQWRQQGPEGARVSNHNGKIAKCSRCRMMKKAKMMRLELRRRLEWMPGPPMAKILSSQAAVKTMSHTTVDAPNAEVILRLRFKHASSPKFIRRMCWLVNTASSGSTRASP